MDTKHTPGEWEALKGQTNINESQGKAWGCVHDAEGFIIADVWADSERLDGEANARLIAAAPELLAAIQPLRDALARAVGGFELAVRGCPVRDMTETIHEARAADKQAAAALAKAEGR